jgi:hypothetical protein
MVFIPRKMSDELIARFRVGCPILLCYSLVDIHAYTIIELSQKDEFFVFNNVGFVEEENIQVSESGTDFLGDPIYQIQDSEGVHARISWKISLETFEIICQKLTEKS